MSIRVLHLDGDAISRRRIGRALGDRGFLVHDVGDSSAVLQLAQRDGCDVALFEWALPGPLDGLALARALSECSPQTGRIILTRFKSSSRRRHALEEVVDDYLIKPVAADELAARISAVARRCRSAPRPPAQWRLGQADLHLELLARRATVPGRTLDLQPRQFDLLAYLLDHAGRFVSEQELLRNVWGSHHDRESSVVRVQISHLRKALGEYRGAIETGPSRCGWRVRACSE